MIHDLRHFENAILGGPYVSPHFFFQVCCNLRIIYVGALKDWL
jgi:hypothetical protein